MVLFFQSPTEPYTTPTIFKWKPSNLLTIDLRYKNNNVYVYNNQGTEVLFVPFQKIIPVKLRKIGKPIRGKTILNNIIFIQNKHLQENKIIEFSINPINKTFTPLRIREDKNRPNYIKIAYDILNNLKKSYHPK